MAGSWHAGRAPMSGYSGYWQRVPARVRDRLRALGDRLDRLRSYRPGWQCCVTSWLLILLAGVGSAALADRYQHHALRQIHNQQSALAQAQIAMLLESVHHYAAGAVAVTWPARSAAFAALHSAAEQFSGAKQVAKTTQDALWAAMGWLDQAARQQGVAVRRLHAVESALIEIELAGGRLALADFLNALALAGGAVRASQFVISEVAGPTTAAIESSQRSQVGREVAAPPISALLQLAVYPWSGELPSMLGETSVSVGGHETAQSLTSERDSAAAVVWRNQRVSAWRRGPDGSLSRQTGVITQPDASAQSSQPETRILQ